MFTNIKKVNGRLELPAVPPKTIPLSFYFIATVLLCISTPLASFAQDVHEEAVKIVIRAETDAWMRRDADAWQNVWVQSDKASRTIVTHEELEDAVGWTNFGPAVIKDLKENPGDEVREFRHYNYSIRISDEMAWVNFDQKVNSPKTGNRTVSREQRVLVVDDGRWRILSQITYLPETFESAPEPAPETIQSKLHAISYDLSEEKKLNEAIEVLEMSAKLFPESEETYSKLGSAYAEAGKRRQAIKNYKKCLQLNPENDEAKKGMADLE